MKSLKPAVEFDEQLKHFKDEGYFVKVPGNWPE